MHRITQFVRHAVDLLLLAIRVAVLTLAARVRVPPAPSAAGFGRPTSNNFEGILINHKNVHRIAPAHSPHANVPKSSNLFQQKDLHEMTAVNPALCTR
jgi:hypothetical protein